MAMGLFIKQITTSKQSVLPICTVTGVSHNTWQNELKNELQELFQFDLCLDVFDFKNKSRSIISSLPGTDANSKYDPNHDLAAVNRK